MRSLFIIGILVLLYACSSQTEQKNQSSIPLEYTFLKENSQSHPKIRGIWKSIGNGYFLEIREDSLLLYSYTQSFCYKEKNDYLEGLLHTQSQFELRRDTLGIYLTDYGEASRKLQAKKDFLRIDAFPDNCLSFAQMTQMPAEDKFKLYQETLEENYAFAQERNLDWKDLFASYQDSIGRGENALFESIGKVATLTKDQHTKVISQDGSSRQYRITPSALVVKAAFEKQSEIKDLNEYYNQFFTSHKSQISDSLLRGKGQKVANGNIEWGKINDRVGYIHIFSFAGFLDKNYTRAQQIDSIKMHMNTIIEALQDTEALILDVSFNFGGYDAAALTIAGYFTDVSRFAYTSQVYNNGVFYDEDKIWVYPSERTYTKPVYLLSTDISRSAAECFGMMMDALPNVQLAGIPTLGTLSGMLGKSIGDFYTTYSNQRLINSAGEYYEVRGLEPAIPLQVFPKDDVMQGHLRAVRKLVSLIEQK